MHSKLIECTGGSDGLRDETVLQSALAAPMASFGGEDLFPDVVSKVVRLGYGLAANHAFVDGNKRIGAHAMLAVLKANNVKLSYQQFELEQVFWDVASLKLSYEGLLNWVQCHIVK